jgi:hypothetical protein
MKDRIAMNDKVSPSQLPDPATLSQQSGWRRHFTRQRLRAFIILSVAAHLIVGLSWGVPAYVKQKQLEAEQRRQEALRDEQLKKAAEAAAKAKVRDLEQTVQDVANQTHKAFEAIAGDLNNSDKQKTWEAVEPKVQPAEKQLAEALGDRSMTEQDLRNLQAGLDRQLIEAINQSLGNDVGREEIESFLAAIERRVVPALVTHYKTELVSKVAHPVRAAADGFVKLTRDEAAASVGASASDRNAVGLALKQFADAVDAAGGEADQAQLLAGRKTPASADEIARHATAATDHLTAATTAADSAAAELSKLIGQAKSSDGGSGLGQRLASTQSQLTQVGGAVKTAVAALAGADYAAASRQLTASSLGERKIGAQWAAVADAADQATSYAELSARAALAGVKDSIIPQNVDQNLDEGFKQKVSDRLTAALKDALAKRLATAGLKPDEAILTSTAQRVKAILEAKVPAAGGYGLSTSQALRDLAAPTKRSRTNASENVEGLAAKFTLTAGPVIASGVDQVLADASIDPKLVELVVKPDKDPGRDDVRDRVAMLTARASDGRANALDTTSFTDLRASAMARTVQRDNNAVAPDSSPAPTTGPTDAPPVIEDIKKEILASLKAELQKVLEGKLAQERTEKVWNHVAKATDGDVNHLSQDLVDPKVSDSDLEGRRQEFSKKFLDSVKGGLDKTASEDVAKELVKELEGKAGDAVAGAYKNAVKENVGTALGREWKAAADAERNTASLQVRDIRAALESAKSVADKAGQILDQVKAQTAAVSQKGKGDPDAVKQAIESSRGKLAEINKALADAKTDVDKAQKDIPDHAAELKDRLGEIGKAFDNVTASVTEADKTGQAGQAKPFTKAVVDARKQVDKFRSNLTNGAAGLDKEVMETQAQFTKATEKATDDAADGTPGVKSRVEKKFDGAFRKDALPRLTDQIAKGYQQKLEQAGVSADPADAAALEEAIAAALDKKVTGEAHVGEAALSGLEQKKFFASAKLAKSEPTKEQVDRANAIADKVVAAGVTATVEGDAAETGARSVVSKMAGPDKAVGELKDKVARMQGQLRGGRGGVLADAAEGADAKASEGSVAAMRRKWQGLLAGLNGAEDSNGGGKPGGAQASAGAGTVAGSAVGAGQDVGPAGGRGPGFGDGTMDEFGRYYGTRRLPVDREKYKKLIDQLKDRATQQGEAWDRSGADGLALHQGHDEGAIHPAAIVAPATQPVQSAKNDQPYTPTFKSLQFAVVPYLNHPVPIGDNFDAWNDIPAIHLRPETHWLKDATGLNIVQDLPIKIAWDNHGLYFMLDMIDPDRKIAKAHLNNFWECDAMEVFLDTLNTKESRRGTGAGQQFWCWPFGSLDDENAHGGESIYDRHSGFHFGVLKPEDLPRFAKMTPSGYLLQWVIPTERVRDADLAAGKILGFNITIETGVRMHYYWSASKIVDTSVHPDTWGDILLAGSDGRVEFPAKLASEVGPIAAKRTVNAFVVGEPLRIRVIDRDMNLNDKVKDKVSVTVRNARGEQEVAILEETGPETGIFEGSVRTSFDIGERTPGSLSVNEGESVSVTYIDQARANGARNTEIINRISAGPSIMVGQMK